MRDTVQTIKRYTEQTPDPERCSGTEDVRHEETLRDWIRSQGFIAAAEQGGWKQLHAGIKYGDPEGYNRDFQLLVRRRSLSEIVQTAGDNRTVSGGDSGGKGASSPQGVNEEMAQPRDFPDSGQIPVWGTHTKIWAEASDRPPSTEVSLPELANFQEIATLRNARLQDKCLSIGFDSEWYTQGPRKMLSWQFAFVDGTDLVEMVFLPKRHDIRISLGYAVGRILDYAGTYQSFSNDSLQRYRYYTVDEARTRKKGALVPVMRIADTAEEARSMAEVAILDGEVSNIRLTDLDSHSVAAPRGKRMQRYTVYKELDLIKPAVPVTLIYHAGNADLSSVLRDTDGTRRSVYRHLTSVQGGVFSSMPMEMYVPCTVKKKRSGYSYRVSLSMRDTMCYAGGDSKRLETLGMVVGVPKIDIPVEMKEHMDETLMNDPVLFLDYAAQDAVVALLYASAMFGYNRQMPCTVTGVAARAAQNFCMEYLHCETVEEFDRTYRGIRTESLNLMKVTDRNEKPTYIRNSRDICLNDKARRLQMMASEAFHGGYNASAAIGYFPEVTFDVDLRNAYPTAMCLIPDVDWKDSIAEEIHNRELTLRDFHLLGHQFNPVSMLFCYCRFEFPENVKFPCIPYSTERILVFPRRSVFAKEENEYVYACGPELYLALKLGAKVYVETGYRVSTLLNDSGESYSVAYAMKRLVQERGLAELLYGKGSLQEQTLKVMNNAVYGKIAQAVVDKRSWSAFSDEMKSLGPSAITNPVTAAMTTSVVRAVLLAAMNQVHNVGYKVFSVTTDGFITNMPPDMLDSLDLYGFKAAMNYSRRFLTDDQDESMWAVKHVQDDLLNFSTRGNVSLHGKSFGNPMICSGIEYDGVIARNGAKSPYEKKSYEDRLWIMTQVLGRTGKIHCEETVWTPFKDLAGGKDFIVFNQSRELSMDFDMKRKPVKKSFRTARPVVNGSEYEIACFDTEAFDTMDEFQEYRVKAQGSKCLRTAEDWECFWLRLEHSGAEGQDGTRETKKFKIRDLSWSILNSIIMGYRAGLWDIPYLSKNKLSVSEKCTWIQRFNRSKSHVFKVSDWDHAGSKKRQKNILPYETVAPLLQEMQAAAK